MRLSAILLCAALASCATTQRHLMHRTCKALHVGHNDSIRGETAQALVKAIRYWRGIAPVPLYYGGPQGEIFVALEWPENPRNGRVGPHTVADARWWLKGDCVVRGFIRFAPSQLRHPPEHQESIFRHELGHILGLPDSAGCDDVMGCYDATGLWPKAPQKASHADRELIRDSYH